MSIEGGGESHQIRPNIREEIDRYFEAFGRTSPLSTDAYNIYERVTAFARKAHWVVLQKLPHYEEWFKKRRGRGYSSDEIAYVMQQSNPEAVAAFDQLVDEFNDDVERINKEKDYDAAKLFSDRAGSIISKLK